MPLKDYNQLAPVSSFALIGEVYNENSKQKEHFELGIALDHDSGRLTNERLLAMSDEELKTLAYSPTGVYAEDYRFPSDPAWCKRRDDGTLPNERYLGAHRAVTILAYRKALKAV